MDQARQSQEKSEDQTAIEVADGRGCDEPGEQAPYRTRLHVGLLLAIISWTLVIGLAWLIAKL